MKIIKLNLKKYPYNIIVGINIINSLGIYLKKINIGCDAYVITNQCIKNKYSKILDKALKESGFSVKFKLVPDTEKSKSIEQLYRIIKDIAGYDKNKSVFIIALGGGVIGDLSGFVASIYKRGIPYIQIPTTLLAQVDSSIGGKTAVDLLQGKNLVGAFYQPRLVLSDIGTLKTLNPKQLRSGLAEVIKYGIIKDRGLFTYLEKNYKKILSLKTESLEFIVNRSSRIKAEIVRQDEREEKGIRTILNFGHTIGHALEAAGGYKGYNHGEAVAIGILIASDISLALGSLSDKNQKRIEKIIEVMGLPTRIKGISANNILKSYYHDKKFIGARNRFVLIDDIGNPKITENVPLELITDILKKRIED